MRSLAFTSPSSRSSPSPADAAQLPCQHHDPDLWFADDPAEIDYAKALCGSCPIRPGCLRGALRRGEPWGVWGGELVSGGVVIPAKPRRGRPPSRRTAPAAA